MKYLYKIAEDELKKVFGDIIQIDEFYFEEDTNGQPFQPENRKLSRDSQDGHKTHHVFITTIQHAMILIDYLSYDKSTWDYEPKLCIHFPNGAEINMNRRGNYGHSLEKGDYLIVCDNVLTALRSNIIASQSQRMVDVWDLVAKYGETIKSQTVVINQLQDKIRFLTPVKSDVGLASNPENLPF